MGQKGSKEKLSKHDLDFLKGSVMTIEDFAMQTPGKIWGAL
jgi:hypothetical protein